MGCNIVSLVRYKGVESVGEALALCGWPAGGSPPESVLVKPNLVGWDNQGPYPPWGVLTTSVVLEGLCAALRDHGVKRISIGEASIKCAQIGSGTREIFEYLHYERLVERFGVGLVDFNEGDFDEIEIDAGHRLKVTRTVREFEALISVPVLKTHGGTKVSLGMKNLKGLLHARSKSYCHHPENLLDHFISLLAERFRPSLTLIDGIYANEQGPLHMGFAHRRDLLVASCDVYSADLLGAYLLGYGTDEVAHLAEYARNHKRSTSVASLEVRGGVDPEEARLPLKWDWPWLADDSGPDTFAKLGIRGLRLPKYDHTLCTGCSYMFNPLMVLLMSTSQKEFDGYEILSGKLHEPSGEAKKTFLLGKCQIERNKADPRCGQVIPIKGCPPSMDDIESALKENGIPVNRKGYEQYRNYIMGRYWKKPDVYPLEHFYLGEVPDSQRAPGAQSGSRG